MTLELSDAVLQRRQFNTHFYNLHSTQFMLSRTAKFIDPNKDVLDIGAAVGMYSTYWATKCRYVFAYEAVEPIFNQLIKVETAHPNVTAKNIAMGEHPGTCEFWVDDKRLSNNSFRNLVGGQKIEVDVTTIDLEEHDNVGFIKLDVEGHELEVLRGGIKTVTEQRPVCMVEVYPKLNNGPVKDTFDFFFDLDYTAFYNSQTSGLKPVESVEHGVNVAEDGELQKDHDGDFLFVPKESEWL
jgi:FkbM family methyltransferase